MKRTFSDGRCEVILPKHEFIARLCALIPPPRVHIVRYFGAFAPTARGRRALTARRPSTPTGAPVASTSAPPTPRPRPAPAPFDNRTTLGAPPPDPDRPRRLDWAALLLRVHDIDIFLCRRCGGPMSVLAFITDQHAAWQILDHLGFPTVANSSARARPPPDAAFHFDQVVDDPCIDVPSPD